MKKILIVGMVNSLHLSRWINVCDFNKNNFEIFPNQINVYHKDLLKLKQKIKFHFFFNKRNALYLILKFLNKISNGLFLKFYFLILVFLNKFQIVHAHEISSSGLFCLFAKNILKKKFPKLIISNWGSDIFLFIKKKKLKENIIKILKLSDFYSAECERDYKLAKKYGFKNKYLPKILNSTGINIELIKKIKDDSKRRNFITIKGYQDGIGVSLNAIKSLLLVNEKILNKFIFFIYGADDELLNSKEFIKFKKNYKVEYHNRRDPINNDLILKKMSKSLLYIGLSKSDGVSTSFLEAISCGAFPIQSNTSCACEYVENNKTAFLVKFNDIKGIAKIIKKVVTNKSLLNYARKKNWDNIVLKADRDKIKVIINEIYSTC